jgi:dTDP-4-dehydrorhamnose 3,5-epimerase
MKDIDFVQANESFSKKGVVRGLHFQWNPYMGKLVRTVKGHMVDLF